jgi:hypothetical protein
MKSALRLDRGELAVMLSEIQPQFPEHIAKLRGHLDSEQSEDAYLTIIREVSEKMGELRSLVAEQRTFIASQQEVIVTAAASMGRLADEQAKANALEERRQAAEEKRLDHEAAMAVAKQAHEQAMASSQEEHDLAMARKQKEHDQSMEKTKFEKLLIPTISAIMGVLAGAGGAYFSTLIAGS